MPDSPVYILIPAVKLPSLVLVCIRYIHQGNLPCTLMHSQRGASTWMISTMPRWPPVYLCAWPVLVNVILGFYRSSEMTVSLFRRQPIPSLDQHMSRTMLMTTGWWVAHLVQEFESSLKPPHKLHVVTTHHGRGWGNQADVGSRIQLMAMMIGMVGDKFADNDSWLYRIDTKELFDDDSVEIVKQREDQTIGSVQNCKKIIWHHTSRETNQYLTPSNEKKFFIFNKHPVQQSYMTVQEVLHLGIIFMLVDKHEDQGLAPLLFQNGY